MEHLFIEGPIGLGKSEMLRRAVWPVFSRVGGFYVQRIMIQGRCAAFSINALTDRDSYFLNREVERIDDAERIFLRAGRDGKWRVHREVFEKHAIACLEKARSEKKRLLLLDEIGGIDRECPAFMAALRRSLDGPVPILGVLKSAANLDKLERRLETCSPHNGEGLSLSGTAALQALLDRPGVEILEMTENNRGFIEKRVTDFIKVVVKNFERVE